MNTSPDSPPSDLQPIRATKQRRSLKDPVVKQAVIAHALLGANNSQIAKHLDIDRSTVKAILSATEIQQQVELGRSRAISLIPRSLDVIENRLEKNDGNVAISLLRGTNVLMNQSLTVNQNNIQANTWITMRSQRQAEEKQIIECVTVDAPSDNKAT